jgi:glyceraldehyde 3-phosphate dehydrogenase
VLVSGPSKSLEDCDAVLLKGINLDSFDPEKHKIISMASCTTNALAPVRENFGIKYGLFSQSLTDQPMKDRRDSWAAAENIIPSSSGAARALKFIWNDLQITGKAYRIPTRTGSIWAYSRIVGDSHSSIIDFPLTQVQDEILSVLTWYDNEWGYASRLAEVAAYLVKLD